MSTRQPTSRKRGSAKAVLSPKPKRSQKEPKSSSDEDDPTQSENNTEDSESGVEVPTSSTAGTKQKHKKKPKNKKEEKSGEESGDETDGPSTSAGKKKKSKKRKRGKKDKKPRKPVYDTAALTKEFHNNGYLTFSGGQLRPLHGLLCAFPPQISAAINLQDEKSAFTNFTDNLLHACRVFGSLNTIVSQSFSSINQYFGFSTFRSENQSLHVRIAVGGISSENNRPNLVEIIIPERFEIAVERAQLASRTTNEYDHRHFDSSQSLFQSAGYWLYLLITWYENDSSLAPGHPHKWSIEKFDTLFTLHVLLPLMEGIQHGSKCPTCFCSEMVANSIEGLLFGLSRHLQQRANISYQNLSLHFDYQKLSGMMCETFKDPRLSTDEQSILDNRQTEKSIMVKTMASMEENLKRFSFPYYRYNSEKKGLNAALNINAQFPLKPDLPDEAEALAYQEMGLTVEDIRVKISDTLLKVEIELARPVLCRILEQVVREEEKPQRNTRPAEVEKAPTTHREEKPAQSEQLDAPITQNDDEDSLNRIRPGSRGNESPHHYEYNDPYDPANYYPDPNYDLGFQDNLQGMETMTLGGDSIESSTEDSSNHSDPNVPSSSGALTIVDHMSDPSPPILLPRKIGEEDEVDPSKRAKRGVDSGETPKENQNTMIPTSDDSSGNQISCDSMKTSISLRSVFIWMKEFVQCLYSKEFEGFLKTLDKEMNGFTDQNILISDITPFIDTFLVFAKKSTPSTTQSLNVKDFLTKLKITLYMMSSVIFADFQEKIDKMIAEIDRENMMIPTQFLLNHFNTIYLYLKHSS
ncbi:hypothetical protein GCK72_012065 [Caenorhabditis remanei]|uniref:Uncharacterized protein n=1 Tax=Caenorhabditis remanei TaxID=31234 RepID=A0A6A5GM52_CAERE|nr:hypothetical protein GCK72_012065 [Caenorhabditis remanei]KAF1755615.1 hypothetical protein GCK72_012065 [Caenorhabditis remanei]